MALNPNQAFHLAFATRKAFVPGYRGRIPGRALVDGSQKAVLARLVKRGFGRFEKDTGWTYFVPCVRSIEHAEQYVPDTPERQVKMWTLKAPRLKRLAEFINEHLPEYEATLVNDSYTPYRKYGRIRFNGKTRHGKSLVVDHRDLNKRDRYPVLTVVGPDPMDTNDRVVRWIAERMGISW